MSSLVACFTLIMERVSNLLEEASHLLRSQADSSHPETTQAGGTSQPHGAREPRQIDQPRPLGYVALPVFHFYLWQDVFFVVMASLSGLFDFNLTNGQLLDYNHVPIDV